MNYWFISYRWRGVTGQPWSYDFCITEEHPVNWQLAQSFNFKQAQYIIVFSMPATEEQFEAWNGPEVEG